MITDDILSYGVSDKIFNIPPAEILYSGTWISGDYTPPDNSCACDEFYHDCGSRVNNFQYVLRSTKTDVYYSSLHGIIKTSGFTIPMAAIIAKDYDSIVFVDGHHRLSIAMDLKLKRVPVYIAGPGTHIEDVVSPDSQHWRQNKVSYPFYLTKTD